MTNVRSIPRLNRWLPVGVIGAMWFLFCGPMMLGWTVVGFRDSAYLYFPMFEAIDMAWAEGNVPLWNPFCNFGMPLVADGTSSVFYPGKLIFFARFLGYPSRYGIYLSTHVLLAAWSTYWLARRLRCNRSGATLAAVSFAFGGPAIFQVTNVIYLVSAAWLPIALGCVWKFINQPSLHWSIFAAVACAMMILGGDPQMVYHVGLIASVSIGCNGVALLTGWLLGKNRGLKQKRRCQFFLGQLRCLVVMVVATSLLAAVQVLPTAELAKRSERSAGDRVVNLFSAIGNQQAGSLQEKFLPLLTAEEKIVGQYQFSLPPWALMEMLAPNISGKPFPQHERWTDVLPSNDRMWFASLYVGLIVVVLAVSQIRCWGRCQANVWVSWILLVFGLGAFGWYGAVWAWREIVGVPESGELWAAPVGGVYWWMSVLLPKYFCFRYPAKLFMLASLAISLLGGRSLGPAIRSTFTLRWSVGVGVLVADLALVVFLWFGADGHRLFEPLVAQSINARTMYGPFQPMAASLQLRSSLVHAMVLVTLFVGLFAGARRFGLRWSAGSNKGQLLGWLLVLLTSVDLILANRWLLAEVPAAIFQNDLTLKPELVKAGSRNKKYDRPATFVLSEHFPLEFLTQSSEARLAELVDWQQQSFQARHHLSHKVRLVGSFHSIWPEKYQRFVGAYVNEANHLRSRENDLLLDSNFLLPQFDDDVVSIDSIFGIGESLRVVTEEMNVAAIAQQGFSNLLLGKRDSVTIAKESFDWNQTQFVIQVHRPISDRWLELPVLFDAGWRVQWRSPNDEWGATDVQCTDRDLLKLKIPGRPGIYEIQMIYQPATFFWGAAVSSVSWILVVAAMINRLFSSFRERRVLQARHLIQPRE